MAITIYRSTDFGAPQYAGGISYDAYVAHFFNILKACLVNGYGSKAGLGWELVGEVTTAGARDIAFRNGSHTGCFRFKQSPATQYLYAIAAYSEMTDLTTGVNGVQYSSQVSAGFSYGTGVPWFGSYPNIQWTLIGDNKTFYFCYHSTSHVANLTFNEASSVNGGFMVGEYEHFVPTVMASGQLGNFLVYPGVGAAFRNGISAATPILPTGAPNSATTPSGVMNNGLDDYSEWGKTVLVPATLFCQQPPAVANPILGSSTSFWRQFGRMRGAWRAYTIDLYSWRDDLTNGRLTFGSEVTIDGKTFIPLICSGQKNFYISTDNADWSA